VSLPAPINADLYELGGAVIAHLDAQLRSAERLLELVLRQSKAIRNREVQLVVNIVAQIQSEVDARSRLESDRAVLLTRAADALGAPVHAITIDALCSLLDSRTATAARERSQMLRGTLSAVRDEHLVNRALMRQELAFVDHLMRLIGIGEQPSSTYGRPTEVRSSDHAPRSTHHLLDLQA